MGWSITLFPWAHKGPYLLESESGRQGGRGNPLGSEPSRMNVLSALCPPDVANPQAAPFMGEDFLQIGLAGRALSAGERGGRTKPSFFVVSIIL